MSTRGTSFGRTFFSAQRLQPTSDRVSSARPAGPHRRWRLRWRCGAPGATMLQKSHGRGGSFRSSSRSSAGARARLATIPGEACALRVSSLGPPAVPAWVRGSLAHPASPSKGTHTWHMHASSAREGANRTANPFHERSVWAKHLPGTRGVRNRGCGKQRKQSVNDMCAPAPATDAFVLWAASSCNSGRRRRDNRELMGFEEVAWSRPHAFANGPGMRTAAKARDAGNVAAEGCALIDDAGSPSAIVSKNARRPAVRPPRPLATIA